jgi:integrase
MASSAFHLTNSKLRLRSSTSLRALKGSGLSSVRRRAYVASWSWRSQLNKAPQAERLLLLGIRSALVVDRGDGEPWMPASFSTAWRRFAGNRGFPDITFHGLRHGAASLLLAAGVPDKVALEVMGHADTRIVRHYQEVAEELKRDAATRMDALLGG